MKLRIMLDSKCKDMEHNRSTANVIFSLILPVYNVDRYLGDCLDSILSQDFPSYELIAVDDGSTDRSSDILEAYRKRDSRIHVIRQVNLGSGAARNAGLAQAVGQYIFFIDPDDCIENNALQRLATIVEQQQADIVVFGYNFLGSYRQPREWKYGNTHVTISKTSDLAQVIDRLFYIHQLQVVWNKIYYRQFLILNEYVFPTQRVGQDSIFSCMTFSDAESVMIISDVLYSYRVRAGSAMTIYNPDRISDEIAVSNALERLVVITGASQGIVRLYDLSIGHTCLRRIIFRSKNRLNDLRAFRANYQYYRKLRKITICDCKCNVKRIISLFALRIALAGKCGQKKT